MVIIILIGVVACSTNRSFPPVIAEEGVDYAKARKIALLHLAETPASHYNGEPIKVGACSESGAKQCQENEFVVDYWGEFCACSFFVLHSDDPLCHETVRVIEKCADGSCTYKFSEQLIVCE